MNELDKPHTIREMYDEIIIRLGKVGRGMVPRKVKLEAVCKNELYLCLRFFFLFV